MISILFLFNAPGVWVHLPGSRNLGTWATGSKIFVTKIKNVIQLMKLHQRTSDIHSENNSNNQNSNSKKVWWTKNLTYGRTNPNLITIFNLKIELSLIFFTIFFRFFKRNLTQIWHSLIIPRKNRNKNLTSWQILKSVKSGQREFCSRGENKKVLTFSKPYFSQNQN